MGHFILCPHCGDSYDLECSWQKSDHEFGSCANIQTGFCDTCGGGMGDLHTSNSGETVHKNPRECVKFLKEQVTYMEQYRLEHDTRYCALEAAVEKLTKGRQAAIEESATLSAIRQAHDD